MGWDGMAWDGMAWDGMAWDGMGWHGMAWDGMGWDGMAWDAPRHQVRAIPGLWAEDRRVSVVWPAQRGGCSTRHIL